MFQVKSTSPLSVGRARRSSGLDPSLWWGVLPLVFIVFWAIWPVARLGWEGWSQVQEGGVSLWLQPWQDPYLRDRMVWSLSQAAITTAVAMMMGVPMGWVLVRWQFWGRDWWVRALMLPFVVPTLVAALGVLAMWRWIADEGPVLLILGNLFFNLCLMVRGAMTGFDAVSASRLAAARSLGATPWRAFWRLEWPTAQSSIWAAACLVFLYCLSGFGLALLLGGQRWATAEVEIYTRVAYDLDLAVASVLALWMLLLASGVVLIYATLSVGQRDRLRGDPVHPRRARWAWSAWPVGLTIAALLVFNFGPLLALAWRAWHASPAAWAHAWSGDAALALTNTVRFTAMGLVLAATLGAIHGWAAQRSVGWRALGMVPLVVSPIMVAFGLLLLWPQWMDQLWVLVCAYALLAIPLVATPVAQAVQRVSPRWVDAARTLGASPWRAFWRVVWPQIVPSWRRGVAFAAATMVGEFAVTLLLARPEWLTLSTYIYQLLGRPGALNVEAAWVMSATLMVMSLMMFALIEPSMGSRRPVARRWTEVPDA